MPGPGLGAFRLTTFLRPDGEVEIPHAVLRVPGPGQAVSNLRLGALMTAVDLASGRLGTAVGPTPDNPLVHEVEFQPDTGVRFADVTVPMWSQVKSLVIRAAHVFEALPCLGWDVVVTAQEPLLLEANWNFGIKTQQIVFNRGMRAELNRSYALCTRS
jgi:hypothetical protein